MSCRTVPNYVVGLGLFLLVAFMATPVKAAININTEAVQKSVTFLYEAGGDGLINTSKPLGTGFIVSIPLRSDPNRSYIVLVTARHIVDPQWAHCQNPNPSAIYARFNKKSYDPTRDPTGVADLLIPLLSDGKPIWFASPDEEVDAAVIRLDGSRLDAYDFENVPVWAFPTNEEIKQFAIGDSVLSAGLIPGVSGKKRNYPFFKFGSISSIPGEAVESNCGPGSAPLSEKVWFIAANLVPGNSGSPIFYVPAGGGGIVLGQSRAMLLGIQSNSFLGWDVAGMTPTQYIYEIIEKIGFQDADLRRGPPIR